MGGWLSRSYAALEAQALADLAAESQEATDAATTAAAPAPTEVPACVRRYLERAGVAAGAACQYT